MIPSSESCLIFENGIISHVFVDPRHLEVLLFRHNDNETIGGMDSKDVRPHVSEFLRGLLW